MSQESGEGGEGLWGGWRNKSQEEEDGRGIEAETPVSFH